MSKCLKITSFFKNIICKHISRTSMLVFYCTSAMFQFGSLQKQKHTNSFTESNTGIATCVFLVINTYNLSEIKFQVCNAGLVWHLLLSSGVRFQFNCSFCLCLFLAIHVIYIYISLSLSLQSFWPCLSVCLCSSLPLPLSLALSLSLSLVFFSPSRICEKYELACGQRVREWMRERERRERERERERDGERERERDIWKNIEREGHI